MAKANLQRVDETHHLRHPCRRPRRGWDLTAAQRINEVLDFGFQLIDLVAEVLAGVDDNRGSPDLLMATATAVGPGGKELARVPRQSVVIAVLVGVGAGGGLVAPG